MNTQINELQRMNINLMKTKLRTLNSDTKKTKIMDRFRNELLKNSSTRKKAKEAYYIGKNLALHGGKMQPQSRPPSPRTFRI